MGGNIDNPLIFISKVKRIANDGRRLKKILSAFVGGRVRLCFHFFFISRFDSIIRFQIIGLVLKYIRYYLLLLLDKPGSQQGSDRYTDSQMVLPM